MPVLTVDFETFYDKTYSLSKLTTEEYIRDALFETIGVSVQIDDGQPVWFSGDFDGTKAFLDQYDWQNATAVAHNAVFDMAIMCWIYGIRPKRIVDTLSMARALLGTQVSLSLAALAKHFNLGQKGTAVLTAIGLRRKDFSAERLAEYGVYCCNDTSLTYQLFLKLVEGFPLSELRLIDKTIRMFTEPQLVLDKQLLTDHLADVVKKKDGLLNKAMISKKQLMSNPALAKLLDGLSVTVPMKISPTTGKETFAFAKTDAEFVALKEHPNIFVQAIVAARLGVKSTLEETRTERFIEIASRGLLPVPLRYYAAHTGRWGGDDKTNMQNLGRGSPIKKAIKAGLGEIIIDCDSSQIEARLLAWLSGQQDLVEVFEKNNTEIFAGVPKDKMQFDPYKIMSSSIYLKPVEDINSHPERFVGKTTILGAGYGMGALKFQGQLKNFGVLLSLAECQTIIDVYRGTFPCIPALWRQAQAAIEAMIDGKTAPLGRKGVITIVSGNRILLPNGLHLEFPNLRWEKDEDGRRQAYYDIRRGRAIIKTKLYGGKLVENICQALARIIVGEQLLNISKRYNVVMTVHDSVVSLALSKDKERAVAYIEKQMRTTPTWAAGLPLNCETKTGAAYG